MTYEQFWYGDVDMVIAFRKAHELKIEARNQEMYMQGLYNYRAVSSAVQIFAWGLGGGKGQKPDEYIKHPIPITEREKKADEERKRQHTLAFFEGRA